MSQVGEGEKNSKLGHISSERDLHLRVGESDNVVITLIWGVVQHDFYPLKSDTLMVD